MYFYSDAQNLSEEINISEEIIANNILLSSGVDLNDVPIDIESVMRNYDFTICVIKSFAKKDICAGIAYSEKELAQLNIDRYFVFRRDIPNRDRRYFMSLAISYFVMESKGKYYNKVFYNFDLVNEESIYSRIARVARAVLIPQKSLSALMMSPMINGLAQAEKIDSVAKAFLVSNEIAKIRMKETGLI